jgi:hypothetical protein
VYLEYLGEPRRHRRRSVSVSCPPSSWPRADYAALRPSTLRSSRCATSAQFTLTEIVLAICRASGGGSGSRCANLGMENASAGHSALGRDWTW